MTPNDMPTRAQAEWLRKLLDDGPQLIAILFDFHDGATDCLEMGWTQWSGNPRDGEYITPAGIAAMARYDAAQKDERG